MRCVRSANTQSSDESGIEGCPVEIASTSIKYEVVNDVIYCVHRGDVIGAVVLGQVRLEDHLSVEHKTLRPHYPKVAVALEYVSSRNITSDSIVTSLI